MKGTIIIQTRYLMKTKTEKLFFLTISFNEDGESNPTKMNPDF